MKTTKISVVIIAKNEAEKIGRCIESVRWADEVIVVDGFSTDKTVDIAKSMGSRVVQHAFTGRFADDRNIGMDHAGHDWVLQLDADEIVTQSFKDAAEKALSRADGFAAFKFHRKNFFLGHSMDHGGFHHYIPNLVNKRYVRFEGDVHEYPVYRGREGTIEADIEHHPFQSIGQFVARQNRYTDIAAKDLLKKEGVLPEKRVRKEMVGRSFKLFWKSYVKKQGYREGVYGLIFAILFAFINFVKWAKYWEFVKDQRPRS